MCCTTATRPITETAHKHKENTKIRAETTARRPIKGQNETAKIQKSKTKHMKINIREYYKNKDQGITITINNNKIFEVNTWSFTV